MDRLLSNELVVKEEPCNGIGIIGAYAPIYCTVHKRTTPHTHTQYWNRGVTMEHDEYTGEVATDSTKLTGLEVGNERLIREQNR